MNLIIEEMNSNHVMLLQDNLNNFDDFWSINVLKNELNSPNSHYIVAIDDSEIVGFAGVAKILDELELNYIVTRKDKRNLGIASSLLDNLITFANTNNIISINLEVNEKNLPAIKLYEKFCFFPIGL